MGVLVRVVSTVVDEVTQVVLWDAVSVSTGVLLGAARPAGGQRRGTLVEADIVHHHVAHIADAPLSPEDHLTTT